MPKKNRPGPGQSESRGLSTSPASFRARLEFLAAELAAQGMLSEASPGGGELGDTGKKLDARKTDALMLADRVEALKRVERFLLNCKRLGDPELLQAKFLPINNSSPRGSSSASRRCYLKYVFLHDPSDRSLCSTQLCVLQNA